MSLACHSYVTRMYSYVIRMSLVCGFTMNPKKQFPRSRHEIPFNFLIKLLLLHALEVFFHFVKIVIFTKITPVNTFYFMDMKILRVIWSKFFHFVDTKIFQSFLIKLFHFIDMKYHRTLLLNFPILWTWNIVKFCR